MDCMYEELFCATSVDEVLHATRQHLSSWSSEELGRIPDSCRPGWVKNAADVEFWADRLTDESAKAQLMIEDERKLDRLTSHFLIASVRIRQLGGARPSATATA